MIFALVWIAAIGFSKPQARTVPAMSRILQSAILLLGFLFLFTPWFRVGVLDTRLWRTTLPVASLGLALTIAGILFAIWARVTLGSNWSGRPMVKVGHELIVKGPYRLARHPIYTGLLFASAGSALAIGRGCIVPGMVLVVLGLFMKIAQEERLMTETFPAAYPDYRRRVKALVPWIV
jgi:protein-S-isoprenylcysteine O-methyltransferase Ste14